MISGRPGFGAGWGSGMWNRVVWLWLCAVLWSCASTPAAPLERDAAEYPEAYTRLDEGACVTFVCAQDACGLFRCEDVPPEPGRVVRTRGTFVLPPSAVQSPQRNWGYPWVQPGQSEPVFVIPGTGGSCCRARNGCWRWPRPWRRSLGRSTTSFRRRRD
ncbi:DUF2380 domain-containing protein [Pyxidicoccus parkwayensis]|uniref:DUF2380 domain-containing protein n=1 Tax=Pyxidicoccus parkwayensis TaxID=2813578 RepID=A0ABX7NRY5_9BACT|nr:DUF2380 domain-containing protein [Pyxidicoccus parkwaysis]